MIAVLVQVSDGSSALTLLLIKNSLHDNVMQKNDGQYETRVITLIFWVIFIFFHFFGCLIFFCCGPT